MRFIVLRLVAGLAFAASVAGCGPGSVTIALHLPLGDDAVVTVTDETGWLRDATVPNSPALIDAPTTSVSNPTDDLSVLRLQWSGRRCLAKASIVVHPGDQLSVDVLWEPRQGGCSEDVAARYVVDLHFDRAVAAPGIVVVDLTARPTPDA